MYTEDYEQEIDLKDLLFVLLYRWRILLLAAVIGAAFLGGYKMDKGKYTADRSASDRKLPGRTGQL